MIIGLSGTLCAGKDTVAKHLIDKEGFFHISLSGILREIARREGIAETMAELTELGNSLESKFGKGYLAKLALEKVPAGRDAVVSSIRQPSEIEFLRREGALKMIFVDANPKIRFERLRVRAREGDSQTSEDFIDLEKKQISGGHGGINLSECKEMSDYVIENNGTREEFSKKIQSVVRKIIGEEKNR